jgi:ABC-type polysaccharide/polyol phosphate transport system ATPase subunit
MLMSIVIAARGLTKTYSLYNSKTDHALEIFLPFGKRRHKDHHALKDVSFDVIKGESVGIIGRNGSGKSTLLKIISGVLKPTSGEVLVDGTIASLLELGAGFNPELTGRENIHFHGALMGCSKAEMCERAEAIIAFADIGEFIDQPVKVFSSGMFVRLAFSVSIHVDPDILIVDEALAVGDVRFQKKCVDFMRAFKARGKTILFVSHDIFTVKSFCDRLILIDNGRIEAIGDRDHVANRYYQLMFPKAETTLVTGTPAEKPLTQKTAAQEGRYWLEVGMSGADKHWGDGSAWINQLRIGGLRPPNLFTWDDAIEIEMVCEWNREAISDVCAEHGVHARLLVGFRLENSQGWVITNFASNDFANNNPKIDLSSTTKCVIRCSIEPMKLAPGTYFVSPGLAVGELTRMFPLKEYTNLINLYCDTSAVLHGQMVLGYSLEVLSNA